MIVGAIIRDSAWLALARKRATRAPAPPGDTRDTGERPDDSPDPRNPSRERGRLVDQRA